MSDADQNDARTHPDTNVSNSKSRRHEPQQWTAVIELNSLQALHRDQQQQQHQHQHQQAACHMSPTEPLLPGAAAGGTPPPTNTFWPCVANLSKVIIGAGMMAIPQAYCRIGWLAGTCMLVLVGFMTYTTLVFLLRGSTGARAATYSQLTRQLCGPAVMKVLQLSILAFCFGFGVVYLVIIRDILLGTPPACNGLLCELLGLPVTSWLYDGRLVLLALALLVCSPLLLLRTMDRLAVLNVVGVAAIALLALTALGLAAQGLAAGSVHPIPLWPQWQQLGPTRGQQLQALMGVMPVMIACYVAHQSLHPLMPLLQPFSDACMRGVIAAALLIAFAVFGSLAVGSSLAFGPALEVNVLNNFSVTGLDPLTGPVMARALSWSIRGGYLLSLLASLLLYMHPLRACLAEMIWPDKPPQPDAGLNSNLNSNGAGTAGGGDEATQSLLHHSNGPLPGQGSFQHADLKGSGSSRLQAGPQQHPAGVKGSVAGPLQSKPPLGSAFATPAAQAGVAAAAGVQAGTAAPQPSSSGCGSSALSGSSNSKQLMPFDSLDNPRTGSWSGVRYLTDMGAQPPQQQQQQQDGRSYSSASSNSSSTLPRHRVEHGRSDSVASGAEAAAHGQPQHQQQQPTAGLTYYREGVQIHVTDAGSVGRSGGQQAVQQEAQQGLSGSNGSSSWREAEQRWYYLLTYGLLAAMVLVAIAVPNIWTALSAIGDLASTLQAFVVPGLIGVILMRQHKLAAGSSVSARLCHAADGGVGVFAVALGLGLFVNGIYQRL